MIIENNLPEKINHRAIKRRIKEKYGIDVGIECEYDENDRPIKITLLHTEPLPEGVESEAIVESEETEEAEEELKMLETGVLKRIREELKEIRKEYKEELQSLKAEIVLLKSKRGLNAS